VQDLLRWRHASVCARPAGDFCSTAIVEKELHEVVGVDANAPTKRTSSDCDSSENLPDDSSCPSAPLSSEAEDDAAVKEDLEQGSLEKSVATPFSVQDLLRWRQASPCARPEGTFCSSAMPEPEAQVIVPAEVACQQADSSLSLEVTPVVEVVPAPLASEVSSKRKISSDAPKEKSWRNVETTTKLKVSEDSWAARQRARRSSQTSEIESLSDEEVVRAMKCILNKLTLEKFDSLSHQLIHCGMSSAKHVELLIQELFEKATTQLHFIDMYADLCTLLNAHFAENPIDAKMNFKKVLLNCCQESFEKNLEPPQGLESLVAADRTVAEQLYKTRMIGNIRFVGALLVRKMLASKVMLAIMEELLQDPTSEALETLAAFLTAVGPTFDQPDWSHRVTLNAIFAQVEVMIKKSSVSSRVRCLLKDVLDLRKCGWRNLRPKKIEGPKKLGEIAADANPTEDNGGWNIATSKKSSTVAIHSEVDAGPRISKFVADVRNKQACSPSAAAKKDIPASLKAEKKTKGTALSEPPKKKDCQEPTEESPASKHKSSRFDRDACRAEMSLTLAELRVSHDVQEAISRVSLIKVPPRHQAAELNELLSRLVEEGSADTRKVCLGLVVGLFLEGHWKQDSLTKGLQIFVEETCPELKYDVPTLGCIVREELQPALAPLANEKILTKTQHQALLTAF
jgi:hypothetical protein